MLFRAMAIPRRRLGRALPGSSVAGPCDDWRRPAAAARPGGTTRPAAPHRRPPECLRSGERDTEAARCPRRPSRCAAPRADRAVRPAPGPLPCIPGSARPAGARSSRHTHRAAPRVHGPARCRGGRGGRARRPRSAPTPPLWGCGRKSDRTAGRHSSAVSLPGGSRSSTRSWSSTRSSAAGLHGEILARQIIRRALHPARLRSASGRDLLELGAGRQQGEILFGQRRRLQRVSRLGRRNDFIFVQPDTASTQRALQVLGEWLVAVAHPLVAALGLHRLGQLRKARLQRVPCLGPHVPDLPLRPPAETQVRDVKELLVIHREGEVRGGGVGQKKAGVLRRNARLERLVIELADATHERHVLLAQAGSLPGFRDHEGEIRVLEGVVALRLLVERDPVVVTDELVAGGARQTTDCEREIDLRAGRGMSALQLVEDERLHLLLRDLPGLDVGPDLLRRELRVAGAEGNVHDPDWIRRVGEELDVDGGIHPGPSYSATPQYLVSRPTFIHNLWISWGETYYEPRCQSPRRISNSRVGLTTTARYCSNSWSRSTPSFRLNSPSSIGRSWAAAA